ncbi:hypothetical protein BC936DRAFT_142014 [Jimgerdemannia flammicorona]|uniref:Uncharacterized protein n=1 Tax=Jimgerdemannia flammicorona TaxID=994334 RepID=A0A433DFN1_9FUNG|nr:hypothetical protein BC936DRAFT_142014 [Jimgerdemannia flammicorona]
MVNNNKNNFLTHPGFLPTGLVHDRRGMRKGAPRLGFSPINDREYYTDMVWISGTRKFFSNSWSFHTDGDPSITSTIDINGEYPNDSVKEQIKNIADKINIAGDINIYHGDLAKNTLDDRRWWESPFSPLQTISLSRVVVYFHYSDERFDYQSDEFLKKWLPRLGKFTIQQYVIVVRNFVKFPSKSSLLKRCRLSLPEYKNVKYFLLNGYEDKLDEDEIQDIEQDLKRIFPSQDK